MQSKQVNRKCCHDDNGRALPAHLCCQGCRAKLARKLKLRLICVGTAPSECGSEVVSVAPARGRVVTFRPTVTVPDGDGGHRLVEMGYRGRAAMVQEDVFDRMADQSRRRGGTGHFDKHQIGAGRDYRALFERCASAGIRCSSTFDPKVGGQGRVDFMDAYMRDKDRLAAFHAAIGDAVAKDIKRRVPAMSGGVKIGDVELRTIGRRLITTRALVDAVCIEDMALSAVLTRYGWRATGKNRNALRAALCAALERMQGV